MYDELQVEVVGGRLSTVGFVGMHVLKLGAYSMGLVAGQGESLSHHTLDHRVIHQSLHIGTYVCPGAQRGGRPSNEVMMSGLSELL